MAKLRLDAVELPESAKAVHEVADALTRLAEVHAQLRLITK